MNAMAQSILIFDFGTDEVAAQQAWHKVEGWKQAFRLGDKIAFKFERVANESSGEEAASDEKSPGKKGAKKKAAKEQGDAEPSRIRILIRLSFSDHEKLSHQRWLDRIPAEEAFRSAKSETIRQTDAGFAKTAELFDALD